MAAKMASTQEVSLRKSEIVSLHCIPRQRLTHPFGQPKPQPAQLHVCMCHLAARCIL